MARRKHALIIGIDSYPAFPRAAALAGARNDAVCMAALLVEHMGFASDDVEVLTDRAATREGIIAGLGRLLDRVGSGDVVWLHFSGHGSRRPTKRGWFRADGQENVLVPHDSAHEGLRPNTDISGGELHGWLRHLSKRTQRTTLVFDCCHAGTMTRDDGWDGARGRARTLAPDTRLAAPLPFPWSSLDPKLPAPGESGWWPSSASYTLIAACRVDQRAREVTVRERGRDPQVHGALSHALLMALRASPRPGTYAALHARLIAAVRGRYPDQHPQLEGPANRRLMRLATCPADRSRLVLERQGAGLVLDGGSVHGVAPGSLWAVSPPERSPSTTEPTSEGPPAETSLAPVNLAPMNLAQVTRVGGVRSRAVLRGDAATLPEVGAGWRASLHDAGFAPSVLTVAIEVPASHAAWAATVVAGVDGAPALRHVTDPARADVVVAVIGPRAGARAPDRACALTHLDHPVVAVVDPDDHVVAPLRGRVDAVAAAETVAVLESLARHRHLRALRNPEPSPLDGTVETRLLRRAPDAAPWVRAVPTGPGEPVRFDHRESFALTLTNRGPDAVYVHVVAIGAGGGIGVVFPRGGATEALASGHTVWVGDRPGESLWFEVPDTVPFARPGARPWQGEEVLLTIVTDDATDLRPLFQGSFRDADFEHAADTHDCAAFLADLLSHGYRERRIETEPREVAWSVDRLVVTLRRRRSV